MEPYVSRAELKATLGVGAGTWADDDIDLAIQAATSAVDSMAGRSFGPLVQDSVQEYDADRSSLVWFNDMAAVSGVAVDEYGTGSFVTLAPTDYTLLPRGAPDRGKPYTSLKLKHSAAVCRLNAESVVRVTGAAGYAAEVPAEVKLATQILATRLLKRVREAPFGITGLGQDGVAVRIGWQDPDVVMLLDNFTRPLRLT
jgi:hypothetical protein